MALRPRLTSVIGVLLTLALVTAQANASTRNDAGTGTDAPGSEDAALAVAYGSFGGHVWRDDVDWYALPSTPAVSCVESTLQGQLGTATLRVGDRRVSAPFNASTATLALATQLDAPVRQGIVGRGAANSSGEYVLSVRSVTGATMDGGDTLAAATPVGAGCITGSVGSHDVADVYTFSFDRVGTVTVSAASSVVDGISFGLYSASGALVATLAPGQVLLLESLPAGNYSLQASSTSLASPTYALALMLPPPCSPNC